MSASLKLKTLENIGYNAIARVVMFIFQAVANIILAQNLSSTDFGVYGFAMIFISFLSQFSDLGINSAAVQKAELDEKDLYTGFTIKAVLGLLIFTVSFLLAPLSEFFIDNKNVPNVMRLLSLNFLINSFAFLPTTLLTRDLDYRKLFLPQAGSAIINSSLSIVLASTGFQYWSIVLANIGSTIVFVIFINFVKPVKIKLSFKKDIASDFIRYGGNLFLSGLIVFAIFNTDNFIIGATKGSQALGYYALAFNWGSWICTVLAAVVLSVLFPTLTRMRQDKLRIKNAYLSVLEHVAFISVLMNALLLFVSREFLYLVLGHGTDKWLPALAALRILCIYGITRAFLEPVGSVILALGNTKQLLRAQIIMAIMEISLLYPALIYFDIAGVGIVVLVSYISAYLTLFKFIKQEVGLNIHELIRPLLPAVFSSIVATAVLWPIKDIFLLTLIGMTQKALSFLIIYCISYGFLTKWKTITEIKGLVALSKGMQS